MEDKLKKFIGDNREVFDEDVPGKHIWYGIEHKLDNQNQRFLILSWATKIAAVFVFVLISGVLIGIMIGKSDHSELNYANGSELEKLKDTEVYYQTQVNLKLSELKDDQTRKYVESDLKQLDIMYAQLRKEMIQSDYSNVDVMINAMITNYKTKVDILENILQKQNQKNKNNEKVSI
ncbi:MAG: hypothetical protein IPO92_14635 [Saprospiraceae bacterium]|nr:hypothetical protein [Saprospiraceae bacterium]